MVRTWGWWRMTQNPQWPMGFWSKNHEYSSYPMFSIVLVIIYNIYIYSYLLNSSRCRLTIVHTFRSLPLRPRTPGTVTVALPPPVPAPVPAPIPGARPRRRESRRMRTRDDSRVAGWWFGIVENSDISTVVFIGYKPTIGFHDMVNCS